MINLRVTRAFILAYGLSSAALYCCLMPLWEGFDELFHYGYVQHVSTHWRFPVIGETMVSRELWASLDYLPVSHYIQAQFARPSLKFEDYFRLSDGERVGLRRGGESLDRSLANQNSTRANYEAQQTPLTYFLLAPIHLLMSGASLFARVLALRLALGLGSGLLLWWSARRFCQRLGLSPAMEVACLFTLFSCQMLYAESCRVGNDAFTVPWLLVYLLAVVDAWDSPTLRRAVVLGLLTAAGLLIKASLLAFLPVAAVALAWRSLRMAAIWSGIVGTLAGPWYVRNLVLYQSLSGNVESTSGVGAAEILKAAQSLPWWRSLAYTAHSGLWTGNNSFTTFSGLTINLVLLTLVIGLGLYCMRARRTVLEICTLAAIGLYGISLVFITLAFFSSSHGGIIGPMPWYLQILLLPLLGLAYLGMTRWLASGTVALWGYVAVASWVAKLFPLYGGLGAVQGRAGRLSAWWMDGGNERGAVLSSLCPVPAPVLYGLLATVLVTLALALGGVMRALRSAKV